MPLSTILILTYIVAMFAAFMLALGGVWLRQVILEARERRAERQANAHVQPTDLKTA